MKLTLNREDIEKLLDICPAEANAIKAMVREESARRGMMELPKTVCWKKVFCEMCQIDEKEIEKCWEC